jgi:hypothetical protein
MKYAGPGNKVLRPGVFLAEIPAFRYRATENRAVCVK